MRVVRLFVRRLIMKTALNAEVLLRLGYPPEHAEAMCKEIVIGELRRLGA